MAGDWIKVEKSTPSKPEVLAMSASLDIDPDMCFGKLVRVWSWFDDHTVDGNATGNGLSVTEALLDRLVGVTGFGHAMAAVGWLERSDNGLQMPHFDYHTSESAKQRALTAKRVAKHKEKSGQKSNAPSVTDGVTCALPREEKSSVSVTVSGATGANGNGIIPPRLAAVEYGLPIDNRATLIATVVSKQDPGAGASLQEIPSLERDDVVAWFAKHIATKHPLCGPTALDLLLVLCFARKCRRSSRAIENKVALFAAGMKSGKWLESAEGGDEEWKWLVGEMKSGRIKFTQQEVAA